MARLLTRKMPESLFPHGTTLFFSTEPQIELCKLHNAHACVRRPVDGCQRLSNQLDAPLQGTSCASAARVISRDVNGYQFIHKGAPIFVRTNSDELEEIHRYESFQISVNYHLP